MNDLTAPDVVCAVCGTNDHARELYPGNVRESDLNAQVFSARRSPDRLHGRILRCGQCGLVYASPLPPRELLATLYASSTYTYGDVEDTVAATYARYINRVLREMRAEGHPPRTALDIGCGNGFVLKEMLALGIPDVRGIEPSRDAREKADPAMQPRIVTGMFNASLPGGTYDLITCFQTFDHVPQPRQFLQDVFHALNPNGRALFINHNIASLTARILGERCPMIDIEHTFLHTPRTMRLLFGQTGFTNIRTFAVRNDYRLRYWARLLPMPRRIKRALLPFLEKSRIGAVLLPLYAGNLGVTARRSV